MNSLTMYRLLPSSAQHLACSYYGFRERRIRMGASFRGYLASLIKSDYASAAAIMAYQDRKVQETIRCAYERSRYYRELFKERGLLPSDFVTRADLRKLPVLSKEDVFKYTDQISVADIPPKEVVISATSGTTGTALEFPKTRDSVAFTWAVWWRHRHRFGFQPGDWHVNFTGKPVVPIQQRRPPYWRFDYARKQIIVPGNQLIASKVPAIAECVVRRRVRYFTGYPSLIAQFCTEVERAGLKLRSQPTHVFLGAENVQQFQADVIKRVTGALITDQYGFSEACGNASRCEAGNYHEDWEFGVLECESPITHEDGSVTGRILGTGFYNEAFPFIRYEIGDTATWAPPDFRCPCGRESKVLYRIDGRNEDYVVTPEGNRVMRFDYLFKNSRRIKEAQVVQYELGTVVIRYVARDGSAASDLEVVERACREYISPSLRIKFEEVSVIPRAESGKFRPVVSLLRGVKEGESAP